MSSVRELEERCDFAGAAALALDLGDGRNAARLAALAGDDVLFERAKELLVAQSTDATRLAAFDLSSRGYEVLAARLYEIAGDEQEAALAFDRGDDHAAAARLYEKLGRPVDAAKSLERGITRDETRDDLREALGGLLARHGRLQPAVKVLQQIQDPTIRARTDRLVVRLLRDLGLSVAADELAGTLGDDLPPPSAPRSPSAPPTAGKPRRTMFGRYEIVEELAQTPNAQLFVGVDLLSRERVAIKLLAAASRGSGGRDAVLRFEREARSLSKLRHPNVVPLLDYFSEGPALVMPFLESGSLLDLVARERIVPARAVEIALAVLTALGEAHRVGILHRDIKPSNVLFDAVGAVRVSDFGAAHLADGSTTVTAAAIGTMAYMSPEQRAMKPAGVGSDLYAVGVLLLEMVAGYLPRVPAVMLLSAHHQDLDPRHDAVLRTLLAKDPADRPGNADEAKKLLRSIPWSDRPPTIDRRELAAPVQRVGPDERFSPVESAGGEDRRHDTVLDREVVVIPYDERWHDRFVAFAAVRSPSIATVLSASAQKGLVVIERPHGAPLSSGTVRLSPPALGRLRAALAELHAAGVAHGSIDRDHVYVTDDGFPTLAFPRELKQASPTDDLRALSTL
jgi:eukaryotic-like serine/threonine-protein kinase